jgi:hypothetical protein
MSFEVATAILLDRTADYSTSAGADKREGHDFKSLPCFAEAPSEAEGEAEGCRIAQTQLNLSFRVRS